jgi:hypothetical protein
MVGKAVRWSLTAVACSYSSNEEGRGETPINLKETACGRSLTVDAVGGAGTNPTSSSEGGCGFGFDEMLAGKGKWVGRQRPFAVARH